VLFYESFFFIFSLFYIKSVEHFSALFHYGYSLLGETCFFFPPDHKSVTKVCMCSSFHILIENSIKLCMFAFYHIDNCISLWHFNWTIFEGVIYLEYFIKMGGGRNKCFRSNQFLILCYSQTSLCQNWRDKCFYLEIVV
jgi:hypothetical protein